MRKHLAFSVCAAIVTSAQACSGVYYEATTKGEGKAAQA